jgi:hypothetical protein
MATITTVTDSRRGCGWRVPGGMYLVSDGHGQACSLLPHVLHVCPTCGNGLKPGRGFKWIDPDVFLPHHSDPETPNRHQGCPLNDPGLIGEQVLLHWIGGSFYPTPESWVKEGMRLGFSRRVSGVPRGMTIGETWVAVAHRNVPLALDDETGSPAVFLLWQPSRVEYVVKGDEDEERLEYLESRGLTLVRVERATDNEETDDE